MKNLFLFIFLLPMLACHENPANYAGDFDPFMDMPPTMEPMMASTIEDEFREINEEEAYPNEKKTIYTGGLSFKTDQLEEDHEQILKILPKYKAYASDQNRSKEYDRISQSMTIKVPAQHFDSLMNKLSGITDKLESKYANAKDVTRQYYDLQIRISNKESLEQRYIALLKQTKSISEILEIERNLNQIRTDIEQLKGQFKYLSNQISYSTIELNFYEFLPQQNLSSNKASFGMRFKNGLSNGWSIFQSFIIGIVNLWPFLLMLSLVTIAISSIILKKRKKKASKTL